ncbi:hypothetical protein GCM10007382_11890 [Salinibacterium xinjiangense]|uniref:tyrosine-type recombinase/integrase n=1 Tax=Salinibacterium xinjiangense TaxID=386302 RepID=UPI000BE44CED|nr:tyrosine-type recombinase/integrase [Salinibacterium xinjiangense]GGK93336.1 hypothetical protein GCM10007382_11890 [Salinibacterium xinjiangense]
MMLILESEAASPDAFTHVLAGSSEGHLDGTGPLARACEGKGHDSVTGRFVGAVTRSQALHSSFRTISPHDLRHPVASLEISARANPKAVQRVLGHASAAITLAT